MTRAADALDFVTFPNTRVNQQGSCASGVSDLASQLMFFTTDAATYTGAAQLQAAEAPLDTSGRCATTPGPNMRFHANQVPAIYPPVMVYYGTSVNQQGVFAAGPGLLLQVRPHAFVCARASGWCFEFCCGRSKGASSPSTPPTPSACRD